ncbi:LuxR family transcriptional regulator [Pantoea sp. At-9b]|uniref:helix-turn-helix transcriptional regulator n=1 Tax=Pantoea sp. (strain At-9b) TaxID=592316 RepID=UPI0001F25FE0|nr:LuxR family transcriptional regulator [Pantoea sp. At-9b]ADU71885.1 transcriptional regulator, LuxR family [Pantoea sp. At-9b]
MSKHFYSDSEKNDQVKISIERNIKKYADVNYAYAVMNKRNTDDIMVISDIPDYFESVYLKNRYQSIDPIIINALNRVSPVIWDETLIVNSQWTIRKITDSLRPDYNIVSGHTFVLHDQNNYLAVLSLYVNKFLEPEIDDKVKKHRNDLQGVLIDTHEMLLHLYHEENVRTSRHDDTLSARENEILYWSSTGKTYPEIARMLDITVSTVKFHMGKIVKKLGVNNAKHAISLAIELNIISHPSGR